MPMQVYTNNKRIKIRKYKIVGIDLFCGLPESNAGYKNILVITDYVTKYIVTVLLFSKTA
jgi:hypothetical protein